MSADARIAILIDGGFFLHRLASIIGQEHSDTPDKITTCIRWLCRRHVNNLIGERNPNTPDSRSKNIWHRHVYRVFFYDAEPYTGKAHHPIINQQVDFKKSQTAIQRQALFSELRKQRKLALRLGKVNKESDWQINPSLTKKLLRHQSALGYLADLDTTDSDGNITLTLTPDQTSELRALRDQWQAIRANDVRLGLKQKGVDSRIAIDMVSIALKQQARTLILVTGDSDFVPAAKLARREGLEIILDSLGQQVNDDLHEHIDGRFNGLHKTPSFTE